MYQNVSSTLVFCRGLGCLIFPNQEVKRNQLQNKQTNICGIKKKLHKPL